MISAYGQPAALSLELPPSKEGTGAGCSVHSNTSSSANSSNSNSPSSSSGTRTVVDIQVSPCGLFVAVLSPWGILVYSNGQHRMLLGRCLVPRDSEVYGRLSCCCWASDSSALFVSADPLPCVCVFSIGSSNTRSSGLPSPQLQELQQESTANTESGAWGAAWSADAHNKLLTAGATAAPVVTPATWGSSWLMEGLSTAVDTRLLGSVDSISDGDGQDSGAEEEQLQPAAAENASTPEEAIRSLPSIITAYRPPNTPPICVSFCLLLRLPVRPSALCCASMQRQQVLLLVGCSRQPAVFWLQPGGLQQVLGCLYTSDLLRVSKRAGVCPGNAGPPCAAIAVPGVASTAATRAPWPEAAYHSMSSAASGSWGCSCSACRGRCCCFLERPPLRSMRHTSSSNSASASGTFAVPQATVPSSRRCRCLGRRKLITYLFHPKGYTALTELLQLSASAQGAQLLPDLPDVFFCGGSERSRGRPRPTSLGSRSAPISRRCSRVACKPHMLPTSCRTPSECRSEQPKRDGILGACVFDRRAQSLEVGEPHTRCRSLRQLHVDSQLSSDDSSTASVSSSCNSITTDCNSTDSLPINRTEASRSSSTTSVGDTKAELFFSTVALGGVTEEAADGLVDRASIAVADAGNRNRNGGPASDNGLPLLWSNRRARGRCSDRQLELPKHMQEGGQPVKRSLTDDAALDYQALRARCCGGVRQLQLNRRLDLVAVVTAAGELLLLAWHFPLRGYSEVDDLRVFENRVEDADMTAQRRKDHLASHKPARRLEPEISISTAGEGAAGAAGLPELKTGTSQMSADRSTSCNDHSRCKGCGSICIGSGRDGRVAIGHSAREGFVNAHKASETGHSNKTNNLRPWRPLGLQLRSDGVCCCALNGERSLVAVGLGIGVVEVYRLIWPRKPVPRVRSSGKSQQQQTQHRLPRRTHRNVERDGFTLLPQLLHMISVPDDIKAAAAQQRRTEAASAATGTASTIGPSYLQEQSVQSLQWTADGAALAVRWLKGGVAVFSHTGSILFSLPDPSSAEAGAVASASGSVPSDRKFGGSQGLWHHKKRFDTTEASADATATGAAVAAGAAAGSGQLCSWIVGGLSLLHVCPSPGANSRLQLNGKITGYERNLLFYETDLRVEDSTSEQLLEVPVVRSASVAAPASSLDVCGSRCASDLSDRVMIGGSQLLVWSFIGNVRASPSLSLVPLPPSLYTAKAFPVRQAALSPDGAQMLVAGSRGFALFSLLQRRWRLLCMEKQEAQLPTGTLPLGWYTNDIFFVSTPAFSPFDAAISVVAAAAAPEPRSTLNAPDAAPRWLLPPVMFHRFESAVASAVDFCPSRFAAHVPLTIHEKTAWLQQQKKQYQQPASSSWGAGGTFSGPREVSAIAAAAASRETSSSSSSTMWHYAVLFLSRSERLDLRCRVAEIKRLPARPHTTTVLPSLQQQQLLRPAASLGSRCCLCHRDSNSNGRSCMLCSGLAAFALRSLAAGNTTEPLLAIYDALGVLTTYQLQQPLSQQQQQRQPRKHDVVALWDLDLSDFCDRPPQQIRFVGCAWLLLVLLQCGTLLLLRLGMPGWGHRTHHRVHRIPRLTVETFTVVAEGVTGLWVGAEAQLQQHYLLPSSRLCVLRPQQQNQKQQSQERAEKEVGESPACCCSCLAQVAVPARHCDEREEDPQVELHQDEPAPCGLRMLKEVALKQSTATGPDADRERKLSDNKLSACSIASSSDSRKVADSDDVELCTASSAMPLSLPTKKLQGSSTVSVPHATHSGTNRSNLSAGGAAVSPFVYPSQVPSIAAAPLSPLPFQRVVDFPRPAAVVPVLSKCCNSSNLYDVQLQQQEQQLPEHLTRERYAPLSLPALAAERSHQAGGALHGTSNAAGSRPKEVGGAQANGTPGQRIRSQFQTFWAAGRRRFSKNKEKHLKGDISFEAYACGSSSVLVYSTHSKAKAGATTAAADNEATKAAPGASCGFSTATLRPERFVDTEGCSGSGLESSPAVRSPTVAARLWETRIETGWHLWAQTPAGLLVASVGFHYSGAVSAAAAADLAPEQLLAVTDVRLRCALVLPVEARPQPLHIVGVIGELGVAVACTPTREAALGFPIPIQPATQIRLLLQPCTHALLQRQLLAAVACFPVYCRARVMPIKGYAFDAAAEGFKEDFASCTASANVTASNSSSCKRLFVSVSALVRELLASAFAHHLLELSQFGLLMRCISTYLKAAKWRGVQLQPHRNRVRPLLHPLAAMGVPCVGRIHRGALEGLAGNVRTAAAAALETSSEGVALQWLLRLLQRKSPHVFVATLVFCMRKTEPLVSPAVLGSLLQRQVPPADPVTLFTKCLEDGLLQTASLYLLPIQTAEGPLQVRCRRVLPLLRAALAAGDFLLVRKLLHFFWAFFRSRQHYRPANKRKKTQQQQTWAESVSAASAESTNQWPWQGQPAEGHQDFAYRRIARISRRLAHMRSLLWRPLQTEDCLHLSVEERTAEDGADSSLRTNPWLSRVPLELPRVDRLLAARVYQEVEATVAAAAFALFQQQKWLRLFDFAATLALDLPAWLRGHGNGDLSKQLGQPHSRSNQQQILGTGGLALSSTTKASPEGAGPVSAAAAAGAAPTAAHILPPLFSEAVSSFAQQLCVGNTPVSLCLQNPLVLECSWLCVEKHKHLSPTWRDELQVAGPATAVVKTTWMQPRGCIPSLVPPLFSSRNRQQQTGAEVARYLANVLLLSGHPLYTLALAAAVRDRDAAAQILSWYPQLRCTFSSAVDAAWFDEGEEPASNSRGAASTEG